MVDDSEPLSSFRQLDPQVLGMLHDLHFPELYRYARYRLADSDAAEDAASEVFLRLLEAARTGGGPRTSVRGWLFGTLRHIVDDHYRSAYARGADVDPGAGEGNGAPDDAFEARERQRAVRAAMRHLTSEQQHVLALRFGGAYSLGETAVLMGRNVNAIKALQFRALQALRRNLPEETA